MATPKTKPQNPDFLNFSHRSKSLAVRLALPRLDPEQIPRHNVGELWKEDTQAVDLLYNMKIAILSLFSLFVDNVCSFDVWFLPGPEVRSGKISKISEICQFDPSARPLSNLAKVKKRRNSEEKCSPFGGQGTRAGLCDSAAAVVGGKQAFWGGFVAGEAAERKECVEWRVECQARACRATAHSPAGWGHARNSPGENSTLQHHSFILRFRATPAEVAPSLPAGSGCASMVAAVYCGFIRPILEYCAPVWHHGLTRKQTATLERVQKRACRIILGQKYTDYTTGLQMCKLETLEKRRAVLCTKFAHSMTTSERTADLLPNTRRQEHGRNLRNSNKMTLAPCRTARFQNSPVPSLLSLLNTNK
ncbi:hypothetical protein Bbelb_151630 [Branchiostoma belcheri]|nr:hypothetical protein Bbelb_151630 [Branchiostoma belcheri]